MWIMKSIWTWLFELLASYRLSSPSTSPRHAAAHVSERYNDMLQGSMMMFWTSSSVPTRPASTASSRFEALDALKAPTGHKSQSEVSSLHKTPSPIHQLRELVEISIRATTNEPVAEADIWKFRAE